MGNRGLGGEAGGQGGGEVLRKGRGAREEEGACQRGGEMLGREREKG